MSRVFILLLDSLGIGSSADAAEFGDAGADTLGHIAEACAAGRIAGRGPLRLPNLDRWGLGAAAEASTGKRRPGLGGVAPAGAWGYAVERSRGKDTPSGHWEIAGVPVEFEWGYFPSAHPSFPKPLTDALVAQAGLPGLLGNRHASGTQIVEELGAEHVASGKPIVYTSADSVFQVAAHEERFGLDRLYHVCHVARGLVDRYRIGRVIARPFVGSAGCFRRTGNRKDLAVPPPAPTLLDRVVAAGGTVIGIGKIGDIYAHRGLSREIRADGNGALFEATLAQAGEAPDGSLVMTNFVDFDMLFGHRRDVAGYAGALEAFDALLPEFERLLRSGDMAVITADHGCDPTWRGTDHTREHVPVLVVGTGIQSGPLGRRVGFADIGQSVAHYLGIAALPHGASFF